MLFSEENFIISSNYSTDDNKEKNSANSGLFITICTPVFKVPMVLDVNKKNAIIKIYLSGKINIVNAVNKDECAFIAKWLNLVLSENASFIRIPQIPQIKSELTNVSKITNPKTKNIP